MLQQMSHNMVLGLNTISKLPTVVCDKMSQNNHKNPALCRVFLLQKTHNIAVDRNWQIGYNTYINSKRGSN